MITKILAILLILSLGAFGVKSCQYEAYKKQVQHSEAKAERVAREKEKGWREGITKWVANYVSERGQREKELNRTIDDLKSGRLRVKPRLSCPTTPASGSNGGEGGGLSAEDAEFLLREAARADALAEQLRLLQEYVKEITGG